jgi:hypothetical protein
MLFDYPIKGSPWQELSKLCEYIFALIHGFAFYSKNPSFNSNRHALKKR